MREFAKWKTGPDQAIGELGALAYTQTMIIQISAPSAAGGK